MILPKSNRLTEAQLAEATAIVTEFGCSLQPIVGAVRSGAPSPNGRRSWCCSSAACTWDR
jgi:hypothetical protein